MSTDDVTIRYIPNPVHQDLIEFANEVDGQAHTHGQSLRKAVQLMADGAWQGIERAPDFLAELAGRHESLPAPFSEVADSARARAASIPAMLEVREPAVHRRYSAAL